MLRPSVCVVYINFGSFLKTGLVFTVIGPAVMNMMQLRAVALGHGFVEFGRQITLSRSGQETVVETSRTAFQSSVGD